MIVLDMACSKNKTKQAIGVDIDINSDADLICDLGKYPYPIKDNSVDLIISKHTFEHLDDPLGALKEMYRIMKPSGKIKIEVPHFSSYTAYGIGHKHIFTQRELTQMAKETINCKIEKITITFYKTFRIFGIMYLANKYPTNYERFWTYIFPAENIKMIIEIIK